MKKLLMILFLIFWICPTPGSVLKKIGTIKFDYPIFNVISTNEGLFLKGNDSLLDCRLTDDTTLSQIISYPLMNPFFSGEGYLDFKMIDKIDSLVFFNADYDGFGIYNIGETNLDEFFLNTRFFTGKSSDCNGGLMLRTAEFLFRSCLNNGVEVSSTAEMLAKIGSPPQNFDDTLQTIARFAQDSLGLFLMDYAKGKIYGLLWGQKGGVIVLDFESDTIIFNSVYYDEKVLWVIDTVIDGVQYDTTIGFELSSKSVSDLKVLKNHLIISNFYGISTFEIGGNGVLGKYETSITGFNPCMVLIDSSGGIPTYTVYPNNLAIFKETIYLSSFCDSALHVFKLDSSVGIEKRPRTRKLRFEFDISPNPFTPTTTIHIQGTVQGEIRIYNLNGHLVRSWTPKNGKQSVFWNGQDFYGKNVASGTYVVRVNVGKRVLSKRVVLLR